MLTYKPSNVELDGVGWVPTYLETRTQRVSHIQQGTVQILALKVCPLISGDVKIMLPHIRYPNRIAELRQVTLVCEQ